MIGAFLFFLFKFNLNILNFKLLTSTIQQELYMKKTLILQGGGFRIGFSAGVLDAFMFAEYNPFDVYYGISGGAIAGSYYIANQHGKTVEAMKHLAKDAEFVKLSRMMSSEGYMNIDQLRYVAEQFVPFNLESALHNSKNKEVYFIATNKEEGRAEYLSPGPKDWIDVVIASCTLPFVTKGSHKVRGLNLMDGGWSDSLPVQKAIDNGAQDILLIRTIPKNLKLSQSWPDYFGSMYFRDNEKLSKCFANNHNVYNQSIDLINNAPDGIKIQQISPEDGLKCTTYSYNEDYIEADYRYGLAEGLKYLRRLGIQTNI